MFNLAANLKTAFDALMHGATWLAAALVISAVIGLLITKSRPKSEVAAPKTGLQKFAPFLPLASVAVALWAAPLAKTGSITVLAAVFVASIVVLLATTKHYVDTKIQLASRATALGLVVVGSTALVVELSFSETNFGGLLIGAILALCPASLFLTLITVRQLLPTGGGTGFLKALIPTGNRSFLRDAVRFSGQLPAAMKRSVGRLRQRVTSAETSDPSDEKVAGSASFQEAKSRLVYASGMSAIHTLTFASLAFVLLVYGRVFHVEHPAAAFVETLLGGNAFMFPDWEFFDTAAVLTVLVPAFFLTSAVMLHGAHSETFRPLLLNPRAIAKLKPVEASETAGFDAPEPRTPTLKTRRLLGMASKW